MSLTILTGAAGKALNTLTPLTRPTKALDALALVNRAMPDMRSALGADAATALGKSLFDASRRGSTNTAASREQVALGLQTLQDAADSTARRRTIAVFGLGLGVAGGVALLRSNDDDHVTRAPGPHGGSAPDVVRT